MKAVIAEHVGIDAGEISREMRLVEDLNIDSLDAVELVMRMEGAFGISIPAAEVEKIRTVGDVIDYLEGEGGAGVASRLRRPPGAGGGRVE